MSEIEPIKISFQYTQDDFLHVWRHYRKSSWTSNIDRAFAIFFFLVTVWLLFTYGWLNWYVPLGFLISIAIWFHALSDLRYIVFYRMNEKAISQHYDSVIDESGIYVKSSTFEAKRNWEGYIGFMESNQAFLLIQGKELFSIYPKRAFRDENQQGRFRSLAIEKVGANSLSKSK